MKQPISGKKLLVRFFCIMLAVTLLCLLICGSYAIFIAKSELQYCNEAALELYFNGLNHTMEDLQDFNEDLYASDLDFSALALNKNSLSTDKILLYQLNLRRLIQNRTGEITGIFIFNEDNDVYYYCFGNSFLGGRVTPEMIATMQSIKEYWLEQSPSNMLKWSSFQVQEVTILMNATCRNGLYICSMVDLDGYSQTYNSFDSKENIDYVFYDSEQILTNTAFTQENGITLEEVARGSEDGQYIFQSHILQSRFNPETGIGLCGIISMTGLWGNLKILVFILVAALVAVCLLFVVMYSMLQRMLIYPMNQITAASRKIAEGAQTTEDATEYIQELEDIRSALSALVEQKVSLERDNISQAYQKEHALLQYYQLQTRSHFVLNCLKSIYNLTAKGEMEKTLQIISLFSNHMRYVFHDSLSLVTVQAELDEVSDYFRIIQFERSDAILLNQNVDPELLTFRIPPLAIQTFLENFNKYNAPSSKILRFSIRIDKVEMEDKPYVRIRLSDNGVGYSDDALTKINSADTVFGRYHVGIQNLCRRLDLLYKDNYKIAFFNNPSGGANSVIYLPAEDATVKIP